MKPVLYFLAGLMLAARVFGQIPVTDVANLSQNIVNYAALIEQLARQANQISNQVQQIQRMDDQLKRLGNMADVKSLIGFPGLKLDLTLPTKIKSWSGNLASVTGAGIFGDNRGGIYTAVDARFKDFEGAEIERDPTLYKQAQEVTSTVDNFKDVQADVFTRREGLKQAIAQTSDALLAAPTEAEEQKLHALLGAQYSQLAALDSEVNLSAAEIQVKTAEASAMAEARSQADAETRRRLAQAEATKVTKTFTPIYECLLQYVEEKRFTP
jgi:conjugal transfer/entry exclusion protein